MSLWIVRTFSAWCFGSSVWQALNSVNPYWSCANLLRWSWLMWALSSPFIWTARLCVTKFLAITDIQMNSFWLVLVETLGKHEKWIAILFLPSPMSFSNSSLVHPQPLCSCIRVCEFLLLGINPWVQAEFKSLFFFFLNTNCQTISFLCTTQYWKMMLFSQWQHFNACSVFSELLCFFCYLVQI